ncbi:MAG: hypothetical protein AW07_02761 [Candidatus Accumulibacter sp. SK-11]|nr:MAG: hypothetical protein AW07_02761 [Candidatus Accumulibacter sp. SK-11]
MEQGSLDLALTWGGKQISAAAVASTRPQVARVLCGLPAARVADIVPRLFGICRQAQTTAQRRSRTSWRTGSRKSSCHRCSMSARHRPPLAWRGSIRRVAVCCIASNWRKTGCCST